MRELLLVLLLAGLATADDPMCALTCYDEGGGAAVFEAGKEYKMEYRGQVVSSSGVMQPDQSQMIVLMQVIISANTPCDLKMKIEMEDVEGAESSQVDDAQWIREALQEHDLHFSYQAGHVDHLCPHQDEDPVVTNFKRGVLSTLQFSITDITPGSVVIVDEEDVSGWCETEYSAESDSVLIKKKNGCHASSHLPYIPYTHYHTRPSHQAPIFRSHQTCQLQHSSGEFNEAECTEEIQVSTSLASFVGNSSSPASSPLASVTISSSLRKLSVEDLPEGNFSKAGHMWKQAPLSADLMGAAASAKKRKQEEMDVKAQIEATLESLDESLDQDSGLVEQRPHLFSHLVHLMSQMEVAGEGEAEEEGEEQEEEGQLEGIWNSVKDKKNQKNFFLDALMMCEGSQCVQLMTGLTLDYEFNGGDSDSGLSRERIEAWFTALHFHHNPRVKSVQALMGLDPELEISGMSKMATSTMVYKICHRDPAQCQNVSKLFLANVHQEINQWCTAEIKQRPPGASSQLEDSFVQVLRALGNAGVSPDEAHPEICYKNRRMKPEVRVAALHSYRRVGCPATDAPWKILEDREDAEEVRIAAYLALVPCAPHTPEFFTRLKHLLDHEENIQVGSYIWSHVKNLIDNPGPTEYEQQLSQLARQYSLPSRFAATAEDFRTSRNHRYAQFSEMLNFGGSVDSNMIFTPASFLPRHVSMNLSLDLFDTTFSPLEIGGDFSGLETLLERFFGKEGIFGNEKILNLLMPEGKMPGQSQEVGSGISEPHIIRDEKIHEFQKLYNEGKGDSDAGGRDETKASFYLRVYGHEVIYIKDILKIAQPGVLFSYLKNFLSASRSFQILDQEYVRATILGFPLHLKLNATGSLVFDHEFKTSRDKNGGKLIIEGHIAPSLVVSADETLWVDGYISASGLRRTSTHSARTKLGGKLTLESEEGEVAEAHITVPGSEVTKISSSVKVAVYDNSKRTWQEQDDPKPENTKEYCTPDQFNNALGLKMCGSIGHGVFDQDGEPVIGEPYKTDFTVTKTDTFNYYRLYVQNRANVLEAFFDTPGSTTKRKINFVFNVRPDNEGGYIKLEGLNYMILGEYENTDALKSLAFRYQQASKIVGRFEVSLEKEVEGVETHLSPSVAISLGADKFSLKGKLTYSNQDDNEEGLQASLEGEGLWQKVEGGREATRAFGEVMGSFVANPQKVGLHTSVKYGTDRTDPHTLELTMDYSEGKGYVTAKVSQVDTSVGLVFDYLPGHAQVTTNVSVHDTQVASEIIIKNLAEGENQDFHMKASLESDQLNLNYIAEVLYKVSDEGFQAETELKVSTWLHTRLMLTYILEDLHHLAGFHITLNEFVLELGQELDFSQPNHAHIMLSGMAGGLAGGIHVSTDYDPERPLTALLDVYGRQGEELVMGAALSLTSDSQWANFTGRSNLKWFDWSFSLDQNLILDSNMAVLQIGQEEGRRAKIVTKTSPGQLLQFSLWGGPEEEHPDFEFGIENSALDSNRIFSLSMKTGPDVLFQFGFLLDSENKFNSTLRLLESHLVVDGQYDLTGGFISASSFNGSAQATVTLPTGRTLTSDLTLSHALNGDQHTLVASASMDGEKVEGQLTFVSHDGWFDEDLTSLNLTLITPFDHLAKFGLAFTVSGDPSEFNFAEVYVDDIKVRGEVQLGDLTNMGVSLEFTAGDQCTARLFASHLEQSDGLLYNSSAGLILTDQHAWEVRMTTILRDPYGAEGLSTILQLEAPVLPAPFHFHTGYNLTQDQFGIDLRTGIGESELSALVSGHQEWSWQRHLLHALAEFKSPWTEPMALNATYDHKQESIGINLDFQSSFEYFPSWVAEFGSNYAKPEDWKTYFYLDYRDLQVSAAFVQNKTYGGLVQQLDATVNTFSMTYNVDLEMDRYIISKVKGRFTLSNLFDHNMVLTFDHTREMGNFVTKASGTWDEHTFEVDHMLKMRHFYEWSDSLEVTLMGDVGVTKAKITYKSDVNLPSINSTLDFTSQWTEDYSETLTTGVKNMTFFINSESVYGDNTVLSTAFTSRGHLNWDHADTELQVSSSYFDDLEVRWKHDFESGSLVLGEITYGKEFHAHACSDLKQEKGWEGLEFKSYDFTIITNITSLEVHTKASVSANANLNGEAELRWNEYYLQAASTLFENGEADVVVSDAATEYRAKFKYEVLEDLPSAQFTVTQNGEGVATFKVKAESLTPQFEILSTLELYGENNSTWQSGELKVKVDLSDLNEGSLKGSADLESNLGGLEGLRGHLDLELKLQALLSWSGDINGELHIQDQSYNLGVNSSLEVSDGFSFKYGTRFEIFQSNQTQNLKDFILIASMTSDAEYLGKVTVVLDHTLPPKSVGISYKARYGDFKGFLMLGDGTKYELSCRLSSRTLDINAKGIDEMGTKFQYLQGNIGWLIGRTKVIITLNMNSDIEVISRMSGSMVVQQKRDLAITAKLTVNDDIFTGNLKLHPTKSRYRVELKLDNKILSPFETDIILDLSLLRQGIEFKSKIDLNDVKDWFDGNLKLTLPESYLKLKTPFDEFKSFNLSITTELEEAFGASVIIQAPQFCFDVTGELGKEYLTAVFKIDIRLDCSGDPLFLFNFKNNFENNPVSIYSDLEIPALIEPFKLNITGHLEHDMIDMQAEADLTDEFSLGLSLSGKWKEEDSSLLVRYYHPPSNVTRFLIKSSLSPSRFEATMELLENDQALTLLADYSVKKQPIKVNATLHNSILGYEMNANLVFEASIKSQIEDVDLRFSMESAFANASLALSYDEPQDDLKEITFNLKTPRGDAEGTITYLKDETFSSFKSEMTSSLHSFEKYLFELLYEISGPVQKLTVKSSQDHIEMEFNGIKNVTDAKLELTGTFTTTIPDYERLDIQWIQPIRVASEMKYEGRVTALLAGEKFMLEGKHSKADDLYEVEVARTTPLDHVYAVRIAYHNHHGNNDKKNIEIFFTVPHFEPEEVNILIAYDLDNKSAGMIFSSPRGMMGVNGTWDYAPQRYIAASAQYYLSFFDLGSYTIDFSLPLRSQYEDASIRVVCSHPGVNFMSRLFVGGDLTTGNFTLVMNSTSDPVDRVYSLSYINQQSFTLEAQFDKWNALTKWSLTGPQISFSSGFFEWKSNFPGYEALEGSWSVGERNRMYFGQLRVNVQRWGEVIAAGTLDMQRSPYDRPWKKAQFGGQFESPFTQIHHLHVEYDLDALTLQLYYQRGPDTFQVQWNARFDRRASSFVLVGNVPIKGISTFSITFNFNLEQAYRARFEGSIEDSTLESSVDISSDWLTGSVKFSLMSPFTRPGKAMLDWSLVQTPLTFKVIIIAGDYSGKLKTYVEYTWDSLDFEWQMSTTLEETSSFSIKFSYKKSENRNFDGTLVAKANDHFLKMKSSIHVDDEKFLLKFAGIVSVFDVRGSLEVDINKSDKNMYKGIITGELPRHGRFYLTLLLDPYQLKLSVKHQAREVLSVNISSRQTKIELKWTDYWTFTLIAQAKDEPKHSNFNISFSGFDWQPTTLDLTYMKGRTQQLNFSLDSPFVPSVKLHVTYTVAADHKFTAHLTLDKRSYELNGQATVRWRQSSIKLELDSSEDPDNPVQLSAHYNIKQFLVGRMRTAETLGSLVFEWGQKVEVTVTGLRNRDRIKLDTVVTTPFKDLPKLLMGYDGTLSLRNSVIDFACTAYINGTQNIVLSGHTKLSDKVDLSWTLHTTFPWLRELASSLLLMPGQLKISVQYNEETWTADCKYKLSPHFLVTCNFETPIIGYEELSLSASSDFRNDKFIGKFEFFWPQEQHIGLKVDFQKWKLEINLETPWEPFRECSLDVSFTTESERMMSSSELKWDEHKVETTLSLDPQNLQFLTEYQLDRERISQIKVKGMRDREAVEGSVELKLPFESLRSLTAVLEIQNQEFEAKLTVNDIVNTIEGKYSVQGGEFKADLPLVGNFKWSLEAESSWQKLESELSFHLPQMVSPATTSLKYNFLTSSGSGYSPTEISFKVSAGERELFSVDVAIGKEAIISVSLLRNHLKIKLVSPGAEESTITFIIETEHLYLEKLSVVMITKTDRDRQLIDITLRISSKLRNKNTQRHVLQLTADKEDSLIFVNLKLEGDLIIVPYAAKLSIPMNLFSEDDAELKIEIDEGNEELFALSYQIDLEDRNWIAHQILTISFRDLHAKLLVTLKGDSFRAELYYPGPNSVHILDSFWSTDVYENEYVYGVELNTPSLSESPIKFKVQFSREGEYQGSLKITYNEGMKELNVQSDIRYDNWQRQFQVVSRIDSDWIGLYSFEANADWSRDITFSATLNTPEEEHRVNVEISPFAYTIAVFLSSPWLPMGDITFTGEVNVDYYLTNLSLETDLRTGERELKIEAKFENIGERRRSIYLLVDLDDSRALSLSAVLSHEQRLLSLDIDFSSDIFSHLNTYFNFHYEYKERGLYMSADLGNAYFLGDEGITLRITSGGNSWGDLQRFVFTAPEYEFVVALELESYFGNLRYRTPYNEAYLTVSQDLYGEGEIRIELSTTFETVEIFHLVVKNSVADDQSIDFIFVQNGENTEFFLSLSPDNIFGRTLRLEVKTPFPGYEKMVLRTPRYVPGKSIGALLELPGCKFGGELSFIFRHVFNSYLIFSLSLPFEKYEMVSLRYIFTVGYEYTVEARVGKFGFTISLSEIPKINGHDLELLLRVNEQQIRALLHHGNALSKVVRGSLKIATDPEPIYAIQSANVKFQYRVYDHFMLGAYLNKEQVFDLVVNWGSLREFVLLTPVIYPGYVHIIIKPHEYLDDYKVELGFPSQEEVGVWLKYNFHIKQEVSSYGRTASLFVDMFGIHLGICGKLFLGGDLFLGYSFSNGLLFELNDNRIGYDASAGIDPGLLSNDYTSDLQLHATNRTLHYQNHATHSARQFNFVNNFTWNEMDELMPPVVLTLIYDDHSLFGHQLHYLEAKFIHPDIKDIILQGNLTGPLYSTLHGMAEFIDGNSPDMKVVMTLDVPVGTDEEQQALVNISQPYSGFGLTLDTRLRQMEKKMKEMETDLDTSRVEVDQIIRYLSLSHETWQEVNISTGVGSIINGHDFTASIDTSESGWGYTWHGHVLNQASLAALNIKGTSRQLGDFWSLGTQINKFLPEFQMWLQTGWGDGAVYEAGRVRVGLHSPVAAGAIIEHQKFGHWRQDASVGVMLSCPHVLQLYATLDPLVQQGSHISWARLSSPAPQVWSSLVRDTSVLASQLQKWAVEEGPALLEALVQNGTVDSVWERATSNWGYLLDDLDITTMGIMEDVQQMWSEHILPALLETKDFIIMGYNKLVSYLEALAAWVTEVTNQVWEHLSAVWSYVNEQFLVPAIQWFGEVTGGVMGQVWEAVLMFSIDLYTDLATQFSELMAYIQAQVVSLVENMTEQLKQLNSVIQEYMAEAQAAIGPYFDTVLGAALTYKDEVVAALQESCWQHLMEKFTALTTVQEGVGEALVILIEFLQPNEYFSRLTIVRDKIAEWAQQVWAVVQEWGSQLQQAIVSAWESVSGAMVEFVTHIYNTLMEMATQIQTDGFWIAMDNKAAEIRNAVSEASTQLLDQLSRTGEGIIMYITEHPLYVQVKESLGSLHEWVMTIWEKWSSGVRDDLTLLEHILFPAADIIHKVLDPHNFLDRFYEFKPHSHGAIRYNQYHLADWCSFFEPPEWHGYFSQLPMEQLLESQMEETSCLWRLPGFPFAFLPPLFATATISGQHVTTFDGLHSQFLGSCSYLLSKDFVGGEFEVVGIYESGAEDGREGEAGLEAVVVHGPRIDVTLYLSGAVSIPVIQPGAKVYTLKEASVLVLPDLVVSCSNVTQSCVFAVSPKYFNRLGGLLGNFNHDPNDDDQGPGGSPETEDPAVLARLWAVSPSPCYQANQANTEFHAEDFRMCRSIFLQSSSPLSPCFSLVDPQPYFRDCLAGQRHPARSSRQLRPPCPSTSAYLAQCHTRGFQLSPLEECQIGTSTGGCSVDGMQVSPGWSKIFQRTEYDPRTADVVLVVETAECNKNYDVRKIVTDLTIYFHRQNIISDNVRYSLVTVPGEGEGIVRLGKFSTNDYVVAQLNNLTFRGDPASHSDSINAIISSARDLRWRPSASRSIIHVTCEWCGIEEMGGSVLGALRMNDVTYHLMTDFNITFTGTKQEAEARERRLFGFDQDLAYIPRDYRDFQGHEKMRWALSEPDGVCVSAALASGGSVFTSDKWNPAKKTQTKKLLSVFAQRVAKSAVAPNCQECQCLDSGVLQCQRCFTSPLFYIPQSFDGVDEGLEVESDSITTEIKRNHREQFVDNNNGLAALREL